MLSSYTGGRWDPRLHIRIHDVGDEVLSDQFG